MAHNTSTVFNLKKLPAELRNQVYEDAANEITEIDLPKGFRGGLLSYFRAQLALKFIKDPDVLNEAVMALSRRTFRTVKSVRVPGPEFFNDAVPSGMKWEAVRSLEFTETQHVYAASPVGDQTPIRLNIHDIVLRCPNLEVLTFRMSKAMMLESDPDEDEIAGAVQTSKEYTNFLRVLEHENLRKVILNCADATQAPISQYNMPELIHTPFLPFSREFHREAKGRRVELVVNLSPDNKGNKSNPERSERSIDGFNWVQYYDFFG